MIFNNWGFQWWFMILHFKECSHKKVPIMICANKCDLREEYIKEGRKVVTKESGLRLAKVSTIYLEIWAIFSCAWAVEETKIEEFLGIIFTNFEIFNFLVLWRAIYWNQCQRWPSHRKSLQRSFSVGMPYFVQSFYAKFAIKLISTLSFCLNLQIYRFLLI